jgi:regulator of protease activity HflC (stomatin/prohibitin superfamily)
VSMVEVKHVDLPHEMQRAIARQAVAEREKRAKIIHAEGELLAAEKLVGAAERMEQRPTSIQLRYLQTLVEFASERTSTVVFPVPIDTVSYFMDRHHRPGDVAPEPERHDASPAAEPH